ncbi:S-adenosyl-L-methionine-dependent methyltransferase [Aaosphaeria arxii CBS 175.79]|uniref:S-adenosyl-L-methionine-dependent methyltransferase n=1 Tax=Aaosphaeria arxii CBS 175.79 TaxID=1450172 RepID=A0A6A5XR43_9PLEO|nr:S-adenosyl-L-methionine-dependent methyltransferase [Aaosphaeria arxii CBS 175.79]KAF2015765.1 S-adenosyl-L-methionine-dependent methyltransferase [Aaosphaeria arxii CBS 175.79]
MALGFANTSYREYQPQTIYNTITLISKQNPFKMSPGAISPTAANEVERKYHSTKAAYSLPNDNIEHHRLESQAECLRVNQGGTDFFAPLDKEIVRKTIDIGCGTGFLTHAMASEFPAAQIYGVDLSPVPELRPKLPNIEYVIENIATLTDPPNPDDRFKPASFDYVFSRLLIMGLTDWKGHLQRCVSMVKPGGWVEFHDLENVVHRVPDDVTTPTLLAPHDLTLAQVKSKSHPADQYLNDPAWNVTFQKLLRRKGLDPLIGWRLPQMFADAGLVDIKVRRYMYPWGVWEGMTDAEKQFAELGRGVISQMLPSALAKLQQGIGKAEEEGEVKSAIEDLHAQARSWERGRLFIWLYVVYGRKPAE